jgi:hypothetical protein
MAHVRPNAESKEASIITEALYLSFHNIDKALPMEGRIAIRPS